MLVNRVLVNRLNFLALSVATLIVPFLHLAISQLFPQVLPMNDVLLYGYWLQMMQAGDPIFGIQQNFVYPYVSLVPMFLAKLLGGAAGILVGWSALVALLNFFATASLVKWCRGTAAGFAAAWAWVVFLFILGPSGVGRIDAIAASVAVLGLVAFANGRVGIAMVAFTLGAWVKIWPIALAAAAFIAEKNKKLMSTATLITVLCVLMFALLAGGNSSVLSFIFTQGGRGIQIESPMAMFWIWAAKLGIPDVGIYYDKEIITNQVYGALVDEVSALSTLVLIGALLITVALTWRASRAGAERNQIFALSVLTGVLDLIVFNKVGSPQFMAWLALPLIAIIYFQINKSWFSVASIFAIGVLTNLVYPVFYMDLMGLGDWSVALLTVRNILLIALLVHANIRLGALAKTPKIQITNQAAL
jgi:hypothetical protein